MAVSLTINAVAFKTPSNISREKNRVVVSKRSLSGVLLTDIWDFTKKETLVFTYNLLTNAELVVLDTYIDNGAFVVALTDTDSFVTYNASSIITYNGYQESFAGYKKGVTITIEQI